MKRSILTFGIIAGLVIITTITISVEIGASGLWLGYLVMLVGFSTIFVAVWKYREDFLGGVISFKSAFLIGLGITVIASLVYVAVWELYLFFTNYSFIDDYVAWMTDPTRLQGASASEIAAARTGAEEFRAHYSDPLSRLPNTFLEIFPVGFVVSILSALIFRNHRFAGTKSAIKGETS